ncbi:hypothetical protein CF319_g4510 [Tilletia indica]|nr:hypothetical protein CF319_g4510 [Tilletia indica]
MVHSFDQSGTLSRVALAESRAGPSSPTRSRPRHSQQVASRLLLAREDVSGLLPVVASTGGDGFDVQNDAGVDGECWGDAYDGSEFQDGHARGGSGRPPGAPADPFSDWFELLGSFIEAYDRAEDPRSIVRAPNTFQCSCSNPPSATSVTVYDKLGPFKIQTRVCTYHLVDVFFKFNLFPASTRTVRTAISIPLLRTFQALRKHSSIGAYGFAAALEDEWQDADPALDLSTFFRRQIMTTAMWYQSTRVYATQRAGHGKINWERYRPELDRDDLLLSISDLADSCPACFQQFVSSKSRLSHALERDAPQVVVSVDGNFSQKRKSRENVATRQPLPPRRFLSHQQVRTVEDRLKTRNLNQSVTGRGHDCSAKVKAADPLAAKGAAGVHDVTGVMGLCCRHDHPLVFCDITTAGERHHYAVALVLALTDALGSTLRHLGVMYDIGCRFANNERVKRILPDTVRITWTIPLFHVYGHTSGCQAKYSPRRVEGMGWSDGEGMERVWSAISNLISSTRSMSQVNRRFQLEERFEHLCAVRLTGLRKRMKKKAGDMRLVEEECWKTLDENEADYQVLKAKLDLKEAPPFRRMPGDIGMSQARFNQLSYMSLERQRQASIKAGFRQLRASFRDSQPREDTSSDGEEESTDQDDLLDSDEEDEHAPEDITTSELADALFRSLSHYLNMGQQMEDRKKEPGSTGIIARLREAMKNEKPTTIKAHRALETHLLEIYPHHRAIDENDIFTDETRHWASMVATHGSLDAPWWAEYSVLRTVNAFDILLRIREEQRRRNQELRMMREWVVNSVCDSRDRQRRTGETRSGQIVVGRLEALHLRWFHEAAPQTNAAEAAAQTPGQETEERAGLDHVEGDTMGVEDDSSDDELHDDAAAAVFGDDGDDDVDGGVGARDEITILER